MGIVFDDGEVGVVAGASFGGGFSKVLDGLSGCFDILIGVARGWVCGFGR